MQKLRRHGLLGIMTCLQGSAAAEHLLAGGKAQRGVSPNRPPLGGVGASRPCGSCPLPAAAEQIHNCTQARCPMSHATDTHRA